MLYFGIANWRKTIVQKQFETARFYTAQPQGPFLERNHKVLDKILLQRRSLPEIGDILRPRSIWHAVSNYQDGGDGGIKKAVRRKNKD